MSTRWRSSEANWQENKKAIFGGMPPILRDIAAFVCRHFIINRQIYGQGTGRLTDEEAYHIGKLDLDALSEFLADKPYFMGERPSSLDATAFGFLANTLDCPIESPLKDHALSKGNLVNYCHRIKKQYFPELITA
jgi:glutathione S-transferase